MKKIIISGCCGKMGRVIASCVSERDDCQVVAGIDVVDDKTLGFPVFKKADDCDVAADVIIDFSHPSALTPLLNYAYSKSLPVVIATTGFSNEQKEEIMEMSKKIPVFFSFNMSLGINLLVELAKKATQILGDQFDIEIVEKHHNQKIDAPSGTALMLADAINETKNNTMKYMYDRHSKRAKREKNEIGIHAIRGGTIVGEHDVIFAGRDEIITLSHTAMSKEIFAVGSVNAAVFLVGKTPGLYTMSDLI